MAANVESMFYVRETPWHGLGTKVQEAPTSKDALILAGLDWHVVQEPVYTGQNELVQGYKANVRDSDRKVLGVVTDRYKIVQNEEAFSFTDALLGEGVRYETAGSLQGGKSVWLLAHLPHEYIISGERISPYLLFSNTHDGSGAVKVAITPIRVVCCNTLNLALQTAKRSWSMNHTGNVKDKMEEAKNTLFLADRYMEELGKEFENLRKITLSDKKVMDYIEILLPIEDGATPQQFRNMKRLQEDMKMRYFDAPDLKDVGKNAYRFINAVSDFATHADPLRRTRNYKTASPFSAAKWEDDKIPLSYQIQCYHYMSVLNADKWYVAVLIYGTEFKVYCLERDEEMIQNLIQIEKDFWNNHVQAGVIPEPDGSKLADKVLTEYFSDPVDEIVELNGYQKQLERRGELKELIDKMTKEVSLIEQEIKMMMGNAERAKADNYRISWKASQRTDLDSKRMKAEEPEIYDRFKRTSVSRRFVVRAA